MSTRKEVRWNRTVHSPKGEGRASAFGLYELEAFVALVKGKKPFADGDWGEGSATQHGSSRKRGSTENYDAKDDSARYWNGSETWEDAVRLSETGWAYGAERVAKASAGLTLPMGRDGHRYERIRDYTGETFLVDAYRRGESDCFSTRIRRRTKGEGEVVTLMFNPCVSGCHGPEQLICVGTAVLTLADALERSGKRVEIIALAVTGYDAIMAMGVRVKRAEEALDPEALAFWLAHPSAFRRWIFGGWEAMATMQGKDGEAGYKWMTHGYGHVQSIAFMMDNEQSLHKALAQDVFGSLHKDVVVDNGTYNKVTTMAQALDWVKAEAAKFGVTLEGECEDEDEDALGGDGTYTPPPKRRRRRR